MTEALQYIRNNVADFICPADSIANYQQGYPRHEAEGIRAGRGDDHELMRLVMGCVVGPTEPAREVVIGVCSNRPRPSVQNNHSKGSQWWARDIWHVKGDGGKTLCGRGASDWLTIGEIKIDGHCCTRCAAKAAPPSPSGYEEGRDDAAKVARDYKSKIKEPHDWFIAVDIEMLIRNLKDPAI